MDETATNQHAAQFRNLRLRVTVDRSRRAFENRTIAARLGVAAELCASERAIHQQRVSIDQMPDYSRSHLHKGRDYQDVFETWPGRALMWELEQRAIPALLDGIAPTTALDFATGTGRIARLVKTTFPDCRVIGADISEKMLAVAKSEGGGIDYVQVDGREASEQLQANSFDLATAFRFFPNADLPLRSDIADQLSTLVKTGGFVLANNHRNFWSPTYVIQRALLNRPAAGMRNSEMIDLFASRGFEVEAHVSLGVLPQTEEKSVLPWAAVRALERLNYESSARVHTLGYNTLYLFRKVR